MRLRVDPHTLARAKERGTTPVEIDDVVRTGTPILAKGNRLGRFKVYPFGRLRNGRRYDEKRVEVYFVEDGGTLVTVTVYVFYGKWE